MTTVAAVSTPNKQIKRVIVDAAHRSVSRNERKVEFGNAVFKTYEVEKGATLLKSTLPAYLGTYRGTQVMDRVFAESSAIQRAMVMDRFRGDGSAVASGWPVYWKEPTFALLFVPSPLSEAWAVLGYRPRHGLERGRDGHHRKRLEFLSACWPVHP